MAKTSEAKMRANNKYAKKNVSQICLKYITKNNKEILDKLNSVPSKADYVRQLILKDLEREKKEASKQPFLSYFFHTSALKNGIIYVVKEYLKRPNIATP